ncbi:MAG TPA: anti-sigma factor antagonist [Planctomycetaceae bacterium]|jgi:anti-sigma B factor antagonist|nr:anti-sigma factor antagonist [Planctomycetaceae bacterium]
MPSLLTQNVSGVTIVRFREKRIVDAGNIEALGSEMLALVKVQHLKNILLNFEGVEFLSSAAFNKLIELNNETKNVGGILRVTGLRAEILEAIKVLRLNKHLDIRRSEAEALKAYGVDSSAAQ